MDLMSLCEFNVAVVSFLRKHGVSEGEILSVLQGNATTLRGRGYEIRAQMGLVSWQTNGQGGYKTEVLP
jgi:hypothetical protein